MSSERSIDTQPADKQADQLDLVDHDLVGDQIADRPETLEPGEHDAPAAPDHVDRIDDRLGGAGRDLDDDIGAAAAGRLADPLDRVLGVDVDRDVGAEPPCEVQPVGVRPPCR